MQDSARIREEFLNFFVERGHFLAPSSGLIPENDPTVLFTTAGMQQFRRFYIFPEESTNKRITTSQKCIRTGDIDSVGDETHLTFFEMLGNFSFGFDKYPDSYFKEEAILMGWQFLTEKLMIDKKRIYATYFSGENGVPEDIDSLKILRSIEGLEEIKPQGFSDNFWSLGVENSPGGPTVEFYVDSVEVWNLVFNEYIYINGEYKQNEFRGVDTGMGLERLICAVNFYKNVYESDLFLPIIEEIEKSSEHEYQGYTKEMRIIADHIKAAVFVMNDGGMPSNKDQGYIVRRLIRRARVISERIGLADFEKIARVVFSIYQSQYKFDEQKILEELKKEDEKFKKTLQKAIGQLDSDGKREGMELSGKKLFDYYQSLGMPVEVTLEEAKRRSIPISEGAQEEFLALKINHQELSRTASAGKFKGGLLDDSPETTGLHTAAHLLLAGLRAVLGDQVKQRGSNITAERLRFDFSHQEKMTEEEIKKVEDFVNDKIKQNLPVECSEMTVAEAKESGAMGVFDDRYGEKVKVYTIGPSTREARSGSREEYFSREICGGPHVDQTGILGHFKIIKEESSSAGVRRIKATLSK